MTQPSRAWMRGILGTVAVVALAVPGTAFAQTLRHTDPAHDVQRSKGAKTIDVPGNENTDIVHLTIAHTATDVSVTMRLRDFRAGTWLYVEDVKTPARTFCVQGIHNAHGDRFFLTRGSKVVACDGLTHEADKTHDTLVVTVPTTCLQDPPWVQVGVGFARKASGGGLTADDGLRKAGSNERHLTLSKRLT